MLYVNLKPSETGDIITMDIFDEPYYRVVKTSSHLIGQWPYQSPQKKVIITMIIWKIFLLLIALKIIAIVVHIDDPDIIFEALSSVAIDLMFVAMYINIIYRTKSIRKLYDRMRSDWRLLLNDEEKSSLKYHSNLGQLFSSAFAGFAYTSMAIFVAEPIFPRIINSFIETNETVPLKLALPLEYIVIDKEKHYWIMLIISSLLVLNISAVVISCDITYITFVQHVCGLFAVVGCRLENTPTDENNSESHTGSGSSSNTKDVSYKHLVSCIRSHRRALKFAELLEDAYCITFGFIVGINLPLISITGFQIITQSHTIQQLLKFVSFTLTDILHLYFECLMAQQLTDKSLQMQESIANVNWLNHSIKSRNLLIIMTMRSQVPCKLTAAKIMDLSIENFAMMVKTSGSYFTMLLSMQ
nr:olfactory receptor [Microplitis mediator]